MTTTPTETYQGSCHCGGVRYRVQMSLDQLIACDCSICARLGYVLGFVPESQFELERGAELLRDYQFNRKHIHHVFCQTCGVHAFAQGTNGEGKPMRAINVRCLEGVDLDALQPKRVHGKKL